MNEISTMDWLIVIISLVFWLTPVALTIHLAVMRNKSNTVKAQVSYIYGGLWAIALCGYLWIFLK